MVLTLLSLLACGEKSTDDTSTTVEDTNTEDTAASVNNCDPIEGLDGLGMKGNVVFEDGIEAPGNVRVQMCYVDTCFVAKWTDEGFCFPEGTLPAGEDYAFDLVPTVDPTKYANPLTFFTPTENIQLEEPVVIPLYTHQGSGAEDFDAGNGLTITTNEAMPENLYATSVDLESGGLPFDSIDKTNILSAWYIGPFETHLSPAATITISNEQIVAGSTYVIFNGDYENQMWLQTAEITAVEDGMLVVESGLEILSTLLIVQQ